MLEDDFAILVDALADLNESNVTRPHIMEHFRKLIRVYGMSEEGQAVWNHLGTLPPEARYAEVVDAAEKAGLTGWHSEALAALFARK